MKCPKCGRFIEKRETKLEKEIYYICYNCKCIYYAGDVRLKDNIKGGLMSND